MVDYKVTELNEEIDFGNLPYWDVVIIGAGPGGLAASLTTAHRGLTTLVVEAKDKAGGQPQFLYADKNIVDVPGFPDGIRGDELSNRVYRQAVERAGAVSLSRGAGHDRRDRPSGEGGPAQAGRHDAGRIPVPQGDHGLRAVALSAAAAGARRARIEEGVLQDPQDRRLRRARRGDCGRRRFGVRRGRDGDRTRGVGRRARAARSRSPRATRWPASCRRAGASMCRAKSSPRRTRATRSGSRSPTTRSCGPTT